MNGQGKEQAEVVGRIDIEPTFEDVLDMVSHMATSDKRGTIETLRPAVKMADIIRRAQKAGHKSVTFTFPARNGPIGYKIEEAS